jgi:hypothetical protein
MSVNKIEKRICLGPILHIVLFIPVALGVNGKRRDVSSARVIYPRWMYNSDYGCAPKVANVAQIGLKISFNLCFRFYSCS